MKRKRIRIIKASHTGFCFGVKRAISSAERFLKRHERAYSLGPIIHNPYVVEKLSRRGLKVISDIRRAKGSWLVIRSHGIPPVLRKRADRLCAGILDATCPFVKRSHEIVARLKRQGYKILIIGERGHPEVKALFEAAGNDAQVAARDSDINRTALKKNKVAIVAQTTLSRDRFIRLVNTILRLNCLECRVFNTICNDMVERQTEAEELAKKADAIFVVGGRISANTRYLAKICKKECARTYHIETADELKPSWLNGISAAGVVSGASTPEDIVKSVAERLKKII